MGFRSKGLGLIAAGAIGLTLVGVPNEAKADAFALTNPVTGGPSYGLAQWGQSVSLEFTVTAPVTVSALGLFSSAAYNGSTGAAFTMLDYATLYDVTTSTKIAQVSFNTGDVGTLIAGTYSYSKAVAPVTIGGSDVYAISAFYTNGIDLFASGTGGTSPGSVADTSGLVNFLANGYLATTGDQNTIPGTLVDAGVAPRYGAATFAFSATTSVPEPSSLAILFVGAAGLTFLRRGNRAS